MHIEESFICGKHTAADCEDGIVCTPNFVAVIDGSTEQDTLPTRPNDEENGRFAMLLIRNYIRQMAAEATLDGGVLPEHNEPHRRGIRRARHIRTHGCASRGASHRFCNSIQRTSEGGMDGGRVPGHRQTACSTKTRSLASRQTAMQRADMIKGGMTPADARHVIEPIDKGNARRPEPPVCRNRRHDDIHARHTTRQRMQLRRACLRRLPHSAAHASRHRKGAGKTTRRRPAEHPQLCGYERSR